MSPTSRLLLVRHGQSEWNALGKWQGQANPPLTDMGLRQAATAADAIGMVDAIVASPLIRAYTTAQTIAEAIGVGPVIVVDDLQERDSGPWSGMTRVEIEQAYPGFLETGRRPDGYEPDDELLPRVLNALATIATAHPGADVLVVTHGGVMYTLEGHLGVDGGAIGNLSARWFEAGADGQLAAGERIELLPEDLSTVPGQI